VIAGPYRVFARSRSFRFLFAAQTLSGFIDWLYLVALFALAFHITHSVTMVALLTFTRLLPYAIVSPFSGALSDRHNRAAIMAVASAGRAVCMLGLVVVTSRATLPLAFGLVFVSTVLSSLFKPALLSSIPSVVGERDLIDANSVMSQIDMVSIGAGPAIASMILLVGSYRVAFVVAALGLAACSVAVSLSRVPAHPAYSPESIVSLPGHLAEGFHFLVTVHGHALLALVVGLSGLSLEGGAVWAILVDLSQGPLHLGEGGPGYLMIGYTVGGVIAGFVVGRAIRYSSITSFFIAAAVCSSLGCLGLGISPPGALPFCSLFVVGIADVFAKVPATTAIQTATSDALLGRVFGATESVLVFSMVAGSLLVAPLIELLGVRLATVAVAALGFVLLLVALPWLRHLENVLGIRVFLRQIPVLNLVPFTRLDDLVGRLQVEQYGSGQEVVRQGESGDRMYVIKRGKVRVTTVRPDGTQITIGNLSRMDYFGEIALLHESERNATVTATTALDLYCLARSDFDLLRQGGGDFEDAMQSLVAVRDAKRLQLLVRA
jgi:MFS family permease